MEAEHYDIHVEGINIDYLLVDILLVGMLAAVFEEELDKTVHRPEYFWQRTCCWQQFYFCR